MDDNGNRVAASPMVAREAIGMVTVSRIMMAAPGMGECAAPAPAPAPALTAAAPPPHREMTDGIQLFDADGRHVARSPETAKWAIAMVTVSRIGMAIPSMGRVWQ